MVSGSYSSKKADDFDTVDPYAGIQLDTGTAAFSFPFDDPKLREEKKPARAPAKSKHIAGAVVSKTGNESETEDSEDFETLEAFLNAGKKKQRPSSGPLSSSTAGPGILRSSTTGNSDPATRVDKTLRWSLDGEVDSPVLGRSGVAAAAASSLPATKRSKDSSGSSGSASGESSSFEEQDGDVFGKVQNWSDFKLKATGSSVGADEGTSPTIAPPAAATSKISDGGRSGAADHATVATRTSPPKEDIKGSTADQIHTTSGGEQQESRQLYNNISIISKRTGDTDTRSDITSIPVLVESASAPRPVTIEYELEGDEYSEISEDILPREHSLASASQSYVDDFDEYEESEAPVSPAGSSSSAAFAGGAVSSSSNKAEARMSARSERSQASSTARQHRSGEGRSSSASSSSSSSAAAAGEGEDTVEQSSKRRKRPSPRDRSGLLRKSQGADGTTGTGERAGTSTFSAQSSPVAFDKHYASTSPSSSVFDHADIYVGGRGDQEPELTSIMIASVDKQAATSSSKMRFAKVGAGTTTAGGSSLSSSERDEGARSRRRHADVQMTESLKTEGHNTASSTASASKPVKHRAREIAIQTDGPGVMGDSGQPQYSIGAPGGALPAFGGAGAAAPPYAAAPQAAPPYVAMGSQHHHPYYPCPPHAPSMLAGAASPFLGYYPPPYYPQYGASLGASYQPQWTSGSRTVPLSEHESQRYSQMRRDLFRNALQQGSTQAEGAGPTALSRTASWAETQDEDGVAHGQTTPPLASKSNTTLKDEEFMPPSRIPPTTVPRNSAEAEKENVLPARSEHGVDPAPARDPLGPMRTPLLQALELVDQNFVDQFKLLRAQAAIHRERMLSLQNRRPGFRYTNSADVKRLLAEQTKRLNRAAGR
ncbi:unnamed protein product [Amoebophrya sp. A120]|nr:unnamed protein product [Amoebophrya sp. A120]|eukprot:GSA120T00015182001.1